MKKIVRFIVLALALIMMATSVIACSNNEDEGNWAGATLKNWGSEVLASNGGMVAETQNNVYFINGQGNSKGDNTLGVPVKGALVGISKLDLEAGKLDKATVVVPKLFVSTDYKAGVYIDNGYVYYGTTNLDKNSDGNVANDEMLFVKTKLDGTGTHIIYNVGSISTEFRISKGADGVVYITFYKDSAIHVLNTKTSAVKTLIKTDAKVKGEGAESLAEYKFLTDSTGYVAVYSTTVYAEDYYADKVENDGIERATQTWNRVYAINLKGEAVKVMDGEQKNDKYALTFTDGKYVFYTQTPQAVAGSATTYGVLADELGKAEKTVKVNTEITLNSNVIIQDLNNVYWMDSSKKQIYFGSLDIEEKFKQETVATGIDINGLIEVAQVALDENTTKTVAMFYGTDNKIYSIFLSEEDAKALQISRDTVTQTWYAPEKITLNQKEFLFYCDNSSVGNGYVAVTNLTQAKVKVSEEEDGKDSLIDDDATDGIEVGFVSVRLVADKAKEIESYIDNAKITLDKNDNPIYDTITEAQEKYNAAPKAVQNSVTNKTRLENLNYAIDLAKAYYELKDYANYEFDSFDKVSFKTKYESATALRNQYKKLGAGEKRYQEIQGLVPNNLCDFYEEAGKVFPKD